MSEPVQFNPQTACDECGQFGAFAFDGKNLCGDCYATSGTCGAGGTDEADEEPKRG
jgi:hypothetical protein